MKLSIQVIALTNAISCALTVAVVRMLWHQAVNHDGILAPFPTNYDDADNFLTSFATRRNLQKYEKSSNCSSKCCTNSTPPSLSLGPTVCTLLRAVVSYEEGQREQLVACELSNNQIVEVTWLPETLTAALISGVSMLTASDVIIDGRNELLIPAGSTYEVTTSDEELPPNARPNLAMTTGKKKVLVIREKGSVYDERAIANEIFGGGNDVVNLASQYAACSYNQLTFSKYTAKGPVNDGVLTVSVGNGTIAGASNNIIREAMLSQAKVALGELLPPATVEYVILCVPFGTLNMRNDGDNWIGYGYVNHYLSVFNDQWCNSPSLLMHEIGHNLGMAHAGGELNGNFDDQSGMMGYSYSADEESEMCFNGPNTYHLGWFPQYHLDLIVSSMGTIYWTGYLIGFAEKHPNDTDRGDDKMIIKITGGPSDDDYYVHFNRKIGFNTGSQEGVDKVLVARRGNGIDYASRRSWLEAQLDVEDMHSAANFAGLTITVNAIDDGSPRRAKVSIKLGPDLPITGSPTVSASPSLVPSLGPSSEPTWLPSVGPTSLPSATPTSAPSLDPTSAPSDATPSPSAAPTSTPSYEPTLSPSDLPTIVPTSGRTREPTSEPTVRSTSMPSISPTALPSASPPPTPQPTYQNEADLQIACTYIGQPSISLCLGQKEATNFRVNFRQMPTQIGLLAHLTRLRIDDLGGTIPTEIGSLIQLVSLHFVSDVIRGTLPTEIGLLTRLSSIEIRRTGLTGGIPTEFGNLRSLKRLHLNDSPLLGTFPSELGKLGQLQSLDLHWTAITGTIPTTISGMQQLNYVDLAGVREFPSLRLVPGLSGTIPTEIGYLSKLTFLELHYNELTGSIPSAIDRLSNGLTRLALDNNDLSGQLPNELGQLTKLTHLLLHDNNFFGTFPESFCSSGQIFGVGPSINCESVACSCCTKGYTELPKC